MEAWQRLLFKSPSMTSIHKGRCCTTRNCDCYSMTVHCWLKRVRFCGRPLRLNTYNTFTKMQRCKMLSTNCRSMCHRRPLYPSLCSAKCRVPSQYVLYVFVCYHPCYHLCCLVMPFIYHQEPMAVLASVYNAPLLSGSASSTDLSNKGAIVCKVLDVKCLC